MAATEAYTKRHLNLNETGRNMNVKKEGKHWQQWYNYFIWVKTKNF